MKSDRQNTKKEEHRILQEAASRIPELFTQNSYVEDDALLRNFGIVIPNKSRFPLGYLKLWPQDFIVEEVSTAGEVSTVDMGTRLSSESPLEFSPTTYATLVKCSVSTIEVVDDLARELECDKKSIGFAGIKDKDALTAQRISFRKISRQKLKEISSPYFFLKDVTTSNGSVATADLRGNRFTILIRTENGFFEQKNFGFFVENLKNIQEHGFYNFFYLQRFGTPRLVNYTWALSILRGEYEKAVFDILTYAAPRELPYFQQLRNESKEYFGDWKKVEEIFSPFPIIFRHELKLIEHLKNEPDDYIGALTQIPDQVSLWIYALASKYFNERISLSIESGEDLPKKLPLFLSFDKHDWQPYENEMRRDGIFPPPFANLKPFPLIQMRHREVSTRDHAEILGVQPTEHGLILSFELSKGQYATTFLSHLFNLVSGKVPDFLSTEKIDVKQVLGKESLSETLQYFNSVTHSKIETASPEE